jgi:Phosphotransferase enzyme family
MKSQEQFEREICSVIVIGRDGTEVLMKTAESGFAFPTLEVLRWERLAENLTAAVRRNWGCDAICLFDLGDSSKNANSDRKHYEAMACWSDGKRKDEPAWKPIRSLTADSFQNQAEFRIFEDCLHQLDRYERDPSSPFARRGWFAELRGWTADIIRPFGLELTGSFCQYNSGPSFSLVRFETSGPAVWFKAVGEPNLREFPVTLKLAERFSRFAPKILGTKPEWNGWLAWEADGTNLGETKNINLWEQAATELARLQIDSISESPSLLQSGAHDLRFKHLRNALDPFFDVLARLMDQQPKAPPEILNREELSLLKLRVEDALTRLEDLEIPNALGHLDLNPGNIIVSDDRCVFLDWAEAYIGCPFFSFEYLIQHFRRNTGANLTLESQLVEAYKTPWRELLRDEVINETLAFVSLPAVFAYGTGAQPWKDEERLPDPKIAGYFRSLARRMNREAVHLIERRSPCLS